MDSINLRSTNDSREQPWDAMPHALTGAHACPDDLRAISHANDVRTVGLAHADEFLPPYDSPDELGWEELPGAQHALHQHQRRELDQQQLLDEHIHQFLQLVRD